MRRTTIASLGLIAILAAACTSAGSSVVPGCGRVRRRPLARPSRASRPSRPSATPRRCAKANLTARHRRQAHDRHRQPGLPAVLRGERRTAQDRAVGARRPDQRPGLRERRRLRDRRQARLRQGRRRLDRRALRQLVSRPAPRPSTSTSTRSRTSPSGPQAVDLSDGYYFGNQSLVVAQGQRPRQGHERRRAQGRTRSAPRSGRPATTTITNVIAPTRRRRVYDTNDAAIAALKAKQIDGLVVDLPTAYYITTAQVENGRSSASSHGGRRRRVLQRRPRQGQPADDCVNERHRCD